MVYYEKGTPKPKSLKDALKYSLERFKGNFKDFTKMHYGLNISRNDIKLGGKGKKLEKTLSLEERNAIRRAKRAEKKLHHGKVYYLFTLPTETTEKKIEVRSDDR